MEGFVRGDVVIIDFPYSNLKESKRRPVLILKIPKGEDVLVLQITGSSYESAVEVKLEKIDFKRGGLKKESYIRIDKIASIDKSLIKYKAGSLKNEKFNRLLDSLCHYLKSD